MTDPRPSVTFACPRCGNTHQATRATLGLVVWAARCIGDVAISVHLREIDDPIESARLVFSAPPPNDCTPGEQWVYVDGQRVPL